MQPATPEDNALQLLVHAEEQGLDMPLHALAEGLDISSQSAASVLQRLEDDGLIEVRFNRGDDQVLSARVLRVTARGHRIHEGRPRPVRSGNPPKRIFISHAHQDRALADALVNLLRLGTDLSRKQVFYSSGIGTGVPMGSDFIAYIRDQLTNTALVVQMITPEFLSSAFCMCELGAVWASDQDAFPILVPPATHDDLRGILGNVHIEILAQDGIVLDRLHDRVKERLALHPDTAAWNSERAKFIHRLSALLGDVKRRDDARLIRRSIDCLTVDIGATEDVTEFLGTLQGLLTLKGLVDDWWYLHDGYFGIQPSSIEPLDIMDLGLLGVDTVDAVGRTLARRIQDGFVVSSEILGTGQLTGYVPRGHAFASDRARYDVGDESENRVFIVGLAHRQIAIAFHAHFSPPDKLSGLELGEARVRS